MIANVLGKDFEVDRFARRDGSPDLVMRLATEQDLPALQRLVAPSMRALSVEHYTDRQVESALVHIFGIDSRLIADGTYFAVEAVDGQVVGGGGWSRRSTLYRGDQSEGVAGGLLDPARDAARLRAFFVHPSWARRGIGRRVIAACEAAARRAGFRRMELAATLPGEPLYAAVGYAVTDRFAIAMPDGESLPVAHMVKVID